MGFIMSESRLADIFNARKPGDQTAAATPIRSEDKNADTSQLGNGQRQMFNLMESTTDSLFITGKAGTGKSYLLNFFVRNTSKKVVVLAFTGVAAINVGGQTIQSFFRWPPRMPIPKDALTPSAERAQLYRCLDAIIIDEASMLNAEIMNAIDLILKHATGSNAPFGGKQMLLFGDLYQLPPVAGPQVARYLEDCYGGIFFFNAPGFRAADIRIYEMSHVFRQKDPVFIDILNGVRDGSISEEKLRQLNERVVSMEGEPAVIIAPTNDAVEGYNQAMLDSIDEPEFSYEATVTGSLTERDFPAPRTLRLKVGARVMMLKNDFNSTSDRPEEGRRWANGTLGQVSKLTKDSIWVMVNGVSHQIDMAKWERAQYSYDPQTKGLQKRVTASFWQFPVKLAWAITVHKAQGATYQSVGVDLADGMFASGQTYVALSRCVDMDKLYFSRPISHEDILVSSEVKTFLEDLVP